MQHLRTGLIIWFIALFLFRGFARIFPDASLFSSNPQKSIPLKIYLDTWSGMDDAQQKQLSVLFVQIIPVEPYSEKETSAQLSLFVYNRNGERVLHHTQDISLYFPIISREQTSQQLLRFPIHLPMGRYRALVKITSAKGEVLYISEAHFSVGTVGDVPFPVSSLLMLARRQAKTTEASTEKHPSLFPYPARCFGPHVSRVYFYFEAYPEGKTIGSSGKIQLTCTAPGTPPVLVRQYPLPESGAVFSLLDSLEVSDLPPGEYQLTARWIPASGIPHVLAQKTFRVEQDPEDLRFYRKEEITAYLRLIGSDSEIAQLEGASDSEFPKRLQNFWKRRDPDASTPVNEARVQFYRRLEYARSHFSRDNQLSDRGKIFVVYGWPDRIERQHDPITHTLLETWEYRRLSLKIIFRDVSGLGEFRFQQVLSHSNASAR